MPDISADMLSGAGGALAVAAVIAGIRWLASAKVRQIDGLPGQIQAVQLELVRISARLEKAESEIANDKAGRKAFAAVEVLVTKISSDIGHLSADVQKLSTRHEKGQEDLWSAVNRIREGRDAA